MLDQLFVSVINPEQVETVVWITAWLAAIAGAITSFGIIFKKAVVPMFKTLKVIRDAAKESYSLIREIPELRKEVTIIRQEVLPNGGKSLNDRVCRIEHRQIVKELQERAILEDAENGIFHCDNQGKNTYINRTYAKILKTTKDSLMGYGWRRYVKFDSEYETRWKAAFEEGREFSINLVFEDEDGEEISCHVSLYALSSPDIQNGHLSFLGIVSKNLTHQCVTNAS